jgi:hypothetical protein
MYSRLKMYIIRFKVFSSLFSDSRTQKLIFHREAQQALDTGEKMFHA